MAFRQGAQQAVFQQRTCFAELTRAFQSILFLKPCRNSGWNSASMISMRVQSLKFRGKLVGALHVRA